MSDSTVAEQGRHEPVPTSVALASIETFKNQNIGNEFLNRLCNKIKNMLECSDEHTCTQNLQQLYNEVITEISKQQRDFAESVVRTITHRFEDVLEHDLAELQIAHIQIQGSNKKLAESIKNLPVGSTTTTRQGILYIEHSLDDFERIFNSIDESVKKTSSSNEKLLNQFFVKFNTHYRELSNFIANDAIKATFPELNREAVSTLRGGRRKTSKKNSKTGSKKKHSKRRSKKTSKRKLVK